VWTLSPRGPDWMPITPKTGSLFHAETQALHRTTVQALNSEAVQSAFQKQMIKAVPHASIDEARAWSKAETARWKKLTEDVQIEHPQ
jgi:hypothetical protein